MSVQKLQLETANFDVSKKTPPTKVPEGGPSDSPKVWERCGTRAPRSPSSKMTFFKCSTRRQAGFSSYDLVKIWASSTFSLCWFSCRHVFFIFVSVSSQFFRRLRLVPLTCERARATARANLPVACKGELGDLVEYVCRIIPAAPRLHLGCISIASQLHLNCISIAYR